MKQLCKIQINSIELFDLQGMLKQNRYNPTNLQKIKCEIIYLPLQSDSDFSRIWKEAQYQVKMNTTFDESKLNAHKRTDL